VTTDARQIYCFSTLFCAHPCRLLTFASISPNHNDTTHCYPLIVCAGGGDHDTVFDNEVINNEYRYNNPQQPVRCKNTEGSPFRGTCSNISHRWKKYQRLANSGGPVNAMETNCRAADCCIGTDGLWFSPG